MLEQKEGARMVLDAGSALALLRDAAAYGTMTQTYMNLYSAYPDQQSREALAAAAESLKSETADGGGQADGSGCAGGADNAASGSSVRSETGGGESPVGATTKVPETAGNPGNATNDVGCGNTVQTPGPAIDLSAVPFLSQINAAEISALAVADAESRSWREPAARGPSFEERAIIAFNAVGSGAASGAVQGAVSALLMAAIKKGSTKIPLLGGLVEVGVIASDPEGWLAGVVDSTFGAASRAQAEMQSPEFAAKLDGILKMVGVAAAFTGTLATMCSVVAVALAVGGAILAVAGVGAALIAAVPLFAKAGLILSGVAALLVMGQAAIRASLLGYSALALLADEGSPEEVSARAAILESSASGFVRNLVVAKAGAAAAGVASGTDLMTAGSGIGVGGKGVAGSAGSSAGSTTADRLRTRIASTVFDVARFQAEREKVGQRIAGFRNSDAQSDEDVLYEPLMGNGTRGMAATLATQNVDAARLLLAGAAELVSGHEVAAPLELEIERAAAAHVAAVRDAGVAAGIEVDAAGKMELFNAQNANALKLADESKAAAALVVKTTGEAATKKASVSKGAADAEAMKVQAASVGTSDESAVAMKELAGFLGLVPGSIASGAGEAAGNASCVAETASAVVASGADMTAQSELFAQWFSQSLLALVADEQRLSDAGARWQEATAAAETSAEECRAGADSFAELAALAAAASSQKLAESELEKQKSEAARARLAEWAAGVQSSSCAIEVEAGQKLDAAAAALSDEGQSS
jgi:hypothetical protein